MLVLSYADVVRALPMRDCIEAMERTLVGLAQGDFFQPLRTRTRPDGSPNWITCMPSLRHRGPRLWALKEMAVTPENPVRGLDPIQGAVLLHDGDDGRLLAVVNAPALTAIRTAAVTAVATRRLAPPEVRAIAIIGAGVQGRAHIEAMRTLYPSAAIRVWSRSRERAEALARELHCEAAATIEAALRNAAVACTVTASSEAITQRAWFATGAHVNAVGSSGPLTREIDGPTLAAASFFVDRRESTINESGDYLFALKEGAINGPEHIRAELGDVLTGRHPGRVAAGELTLFKSLGIAIEDLVAAEVAVANARARGLGIECEWQ